ncbi:MAG: hypothetical protein ABJ360_24515 [Roseobacter sp.]
MTQTGEFKYVSGKVMTLASFVKANFFVGVYCLCLSFLFLFGDEALAESTSRKNCLDADTCLGNFFVYVDGVSYEDTERLGYFSCALFDFAIYPVDLQHYQSLDNYVLYETVMIFVDDVSLAQRIRPEFVPPHDVAGRSQFAATLTGHSDGVEYISKVILVEKSQVCPTPKCHLQASIQFLQDLHNVEILPMTEYQQNRNPQCLERLKQ